MQGRLREKHETRHNIPWPARERSAPFGVPQDSLASVVTHGIRVQFDGIVQNLEANVIAPAEDLHGSSRTTSWVREMKRKETSRQ